MHKFLLVAAAVAVAMILPVMALAENDQFNPDQNTGVVGGSNSSTVKEPEGTSRKGQLLRSRKGRRTRRRYRKQANRLYPPKTSP